MLSLGPISQVVTFAMGMLVSHKSKGTLTSIQEE